MAVRLCRGAICRARLPSIRETGTLRAMNIRQQRGFNLIELMLGITVLAIVLGLGVPSFIDTIRNNRVISQSNDLLTALNYARSEALKRGFRVSACPGTDTACTGGTDWNGRSRVKSLSRPCRGLYAKRERSRRRGDFATEWAPCASSGSSRSPGRRVRPRRGSRRARR